MFALLAHDAPSMRHVQSASSSECENRLLQLYLQDAAPEPDRDPGFPLDILGRGQLVPLSWVERESLERTPIRSTTPDPAFRFTCEVQGSELPTDPGTAVSGPGFYAHGASWLLQSLSSAWVHDALPDPSQDGVLSTLPDSVRAFASSPRSEWGDCSYRFELDLAVGETKFFWMLKLFTRTEEALRLAAAADGGSCLHRMRAILAAGPPASLAPPTEYSSEPAAICDWHITVLCAWMGTENWLAPETADAAEGQLRLARHALQVLHRFGPPELARWSPPTEPADEAAPSSSPDGASTRRQSASMAR